MSDDPYKAPINDEPTPANERSMLLDMIYGAGVGLFYMVAVTASIGVILYLVAIVMRLIRELA